MIKRYKIVIVFFFLLIAMGIQAQNTNVLKVVVKNIEEIQGRIRLQMSSDSLEFLSDEPKVEWVREAKVSGHEMTFYFKALSDGEYALVVFQDMNDNGILDAGKFGIPKEPFAFSKAAMRKFGPPYFSQAKFSISGGGEHEEELVLLYRKPKKKKK
jgi:uncharacterized protein (DUF2141 family)